LKAFEDVDVRNAIRYISRNISRKSVEEVLLVLLTGTDDEGRKTLSVVASR
jgi:hypothetical protein